MPKKVHHIVKRPGRQPGDPKVEIPVAEDLVSVTGVPLREDDVSFYSREYPLESQTIEKSADREWAWTVYTKDVYDYRKQHEEDNKPLVDAAAVSVEKVQKDGVSSPDKAVEFSNRLKDILDSGEPARTDE